MRPGFEIDQHRGRVGSDDRLRGGSSPAEILQLRGNDGQGLRRLNLGSGFLHLASLGGILALSSDYSLPVRATYLTEAPGTNSFSDPIDLFNLNVSYLVAAFLALSALFHFLFISPFGFPGYTAGLKKNQNVFRWVEYSISSSLMIVVILQLNGTTDYIALIGIFTANVCMILFGWLQGRYTTPGDGDMLPFIFGCIAGAVPWIVTAINLASPKGPAESTGIRVRNRDLAVPPVQLLRTGAVEAVPGEGQVGQLSLRRAHLHRAQPGSEVRARVADLRRHPRGELNADDRCDARDVGRFHAAAAADDGGACIQPAGDELSVALRIEVIAKG